MTNPLELSGRTIVVTGASSGIGRDTARLIGELGGRVILVGRNQERLTETLGLLAGEGHRAETFDLSLADEIPAWLKGLSESVGPLHGLVHSAGLHKLTPLRVLNSRTVEELGRVNVGAAIGLAKGFSRKGVCAPASSIVFLSSVAGMTGQAGLAAYSASKGAVIALTRTLAIELAKENIRVNCVAPGVVTTEMGQGLLRMLTAEQRADLEAKHPLGFGNARDVANAVAFLLAGTGRWITGTVLVVDGGYTAQ
ncbi:MAG TPA: SDR family oxidoreductase [Bryobacteraceae bacterium]|jgi:NAD(P)-dependent dehydrogenase (short-subunit alcohol dehydrogenase family)